MPKRVLVVEDDPVVQRLVVDILLTADHDVEVAGHGFEAWSRLVGGEEFDLIISDKDMPGMGGIELLRRVRVDAQTADIPFILMSGDDVVSDDNPTSLEEVCANGGARFLKKPFPIQKLLALVGAGVEVGVAPDIMDY